MRLGTYSRTPLGIECSPLQYSRILRTTGRDKLWTHGTLQSEHTKEGWWVGKESNTGRGSRTRLRFPPTTQSQILSDAPGHRGWKWHPTVRQTSNYKFTQINSTLRLGGGHSLPPPLSTRPESPTWTLVRVLPRGMYDHTLTIGLRPLPQDDCYA